MIEPGNYGYGCDPQKTYEGDMKEAWIEHLMYDAPPEELAEVFASVMPAATALLVANICRNEAIYGRPDIDGLIDNAAEELEGVIRDYVEREWSEQREDKNWTRGCGSRSVEMNSEKVEAYLRTAKRLVAEGYGYSPLMSADDVLEILGESHGEAETTEQAV